jgi:hypothetical protein
VRVKCRGKGHIYWSEGSGDNRRTYSASEDYVDVVLPLYGNGESGVYLFYFFLRLKKLLEVLWYSVVHWSVCLYYQKGIEGHLNVNRTKEKKRIH